MDYSFELNNARRDSSFASGKIKETSPVVEIFSAMTEGKPLSSYGKVADKAVDYIKSLGTKASNGDFNAMSELNEIRTFVIQPKLLQDVSLLGLFGSYTPLGWNETAELEIIKYNNVRADIQAEGQDVSTPFVRKTKKQIAPITISAGHKVNYRELALGNMQTENALVNEVRTAISNKATLYVIETVYKAVAEATGVKYFYENAGLAKTSVDELLMKIRRYGKPNVIGDYAILAQFIPWIGYAGTINGTGSTPNVFGVSQRLLDEIADTGIVGTYNGAVLKEIPNGYNYNSIVQGKDNKDPNYDTLLPAGFALVTPTAPAGGVAPIQTFTIGGLTSFTGNSVSTGDIMERFDLSVAVGVADPSAIGIIHDTNLDTLKATDNEQE